MSGLGVPATRVEPCMDITDFYIVGTQPIASGSDISATSSIFLSFSSLLFFVSERAEISSPEVRSGLYKGNRLEAVDLTHQ